MAEKAANSVSAFGGLGAHGLDFGNDCGPGSGPGGEQRRKELAGSFSQSAMRFAPKVSDEFDEEGSNDPSGEADRP